MDKPISIRKVEFSQSLADVINNSGLPACLILDTLQIVTAQVSQLAEQQLVKDREVWRDALLEESKEE